MTEAHPIQMVSCFIKEAQRALSSNGVGDTNNSFDTPQVTAGEKQTYSVPRTPAEKTRPDLIQSQKSVPPPPVT